MAGVLVAAGVVALRLTDDEEASEGSWDTIVSLDPLSGEIVLLDPDGEMIETDTEISGEGIDGTGETRGSFLLARKDDGWAVLDVARGKQTALSNPGEGSGNVTVRWAHEQEPFVVTADSRVASAVLTDAETGDEIDVGAAAGSERPLIAGDTVLSTADAEVFGFTDQGQSTPQAILVGFDRETVTLPGSLVGLDDEGAAVFARSRRSSRIEFYDLDGEAAGDVDLPESVIHASGAGDGSVIVIDDQSEMHRVTRGGELEVLATVNLGGAQPELAMRFGDRLVLSADDVVVVVDDDGNELLRQRGRLDSRSYGRASPNPRLAPGCLIVHGADGVFRQYDLTTGDELTAEPADGTVFGVTADRCGAVLTRPDATLYRGTVTQFGRGMAVRRLAPDGRAAVVADRDGRLSLHRLDQPDTEPVEIPGLIVAFATR